MCAKLRVELNQKLYIKDPENTYLGWKIVTQSIKLIDELGFEQFTFKKLANTIDSTEASIYRYFESKHKLLIYLVCWYWVQIDYDISLKINNVKDPKEKLRMVLAVLCQSSAENAFLSHLDQEALYRIVIRESSKAYLTKEVDNLNNEGLFLEYKNICSKIALIILEINPSYKYPHALISSLFQIAHQQMFFAKHIPTLTEITSDQENSSQIIVFLESIAFSSIEKGML